MQTKHITRNILITINLPVRREPLAPPPHFSHAVQSVCTEAYKVLEMDPKTTRVLWLSGKWPGRGLFQYDESKY